MSGSQSYMLRLFLELLCRWTIEYGTAPTEHWFHEFCRDLLGIGNNCTTNVTTPVFAEPVQVPNAIQDVLLILYLLVMAASLIGNVVVLLVLGFKKRVRMLSATYIMSLSASGVIMAILAVPTDIMAIMTSYTTRDNIFSSHMSGDVMCKIVCFLRDLVRFANVLTAVGLSLERYLAVVHPLKARSLQPTLRTVTCLMLIWSVSTVLALPCAVLYQWTDISPSFYDTEGLMDSTLLMDVLRIAETDVSIPWYTCIIQDTVSFQVYHGLKMVLMLILPTLAMSFSYISIGVKLWTRKRTSTTSSDSAGDDLRNRTAKRVTTMMVITMVLFVLSWGPNIIFEFWLVLWMVPLSPMNLSLRYFSCWLLLTHTAYNPLLQTFLNDSFRRSFAEVLLCRRKRICPKTDPVPSVGHQGGTYDSSDPIPPSFSRSEQPSNSAAYSDNCLAAPSNNFLLAPTPVKCGKAVQNHDEQQKMFQVMNL